MIYMKKDFTNDKQWIHLKAFLPVRGCLHLLPHILHLHLQGFKYIFTNDLSHSDCGEIGFPPKMATSLNSPQRKPH